MTNLQFHGRAGTLLGLYLKNIALSILTLGVYTFWGKVAVRKYLYRQSDLAGDRFEYHGRGIEIFIGFLKLVVIALPSVALLFYAELYWNLIWNIIALNIIAILVFYLSILFVMPLALFGSKRYRLSRSSWRGIRFHFSGSLAECYKRFFCGAILSVLTLGFYLPYFSVRMQEYWINHTKLGSVSFQYNGKGGEFFREVRIFYILIFVLLLMLVGPTFLPLSLSGVPSELRWVSIVLSPLLISTLDGMSSALPSELQWLSPVLSLLLILILYGIVIACVFVFRARKHRYHWGHIHFAGVHFQSSVTGWQLFRQAMLFGMVVAITLGLMYPWTVVEKLRFYFRRVALSGKLDEAQIRQAAEQTQGAVGDNLAGFFDLDFGIS